MYFSLFSDQPLLFTFVDKNSTLWQTLFPIIFPINTIMMTAAQIRQSFMDFFQEKQHTVVPSASLMPQSPGLLFTNAGMNQFVPYFLGVWTPPWKPARATDTQKCIRAGGKHNDLEDVGQDSYHHTFFEMLGNWSFGDYFKTEAIAWAWELIVERWGFPVERIYATVYAPKEGDPGEFDQEAYDMWAKLFESKGFDPKVHIVNGNVKDNFWMMGETGPCGPCSELHIDLTPNADSKGALVNMDSPLCIEIWNLVFIQYNAESDGSFRPLPARHVDTGMGFERVTAMMQCTDGFKNFDCRISNYNTDVFLPIFAKLEEISGCKYVDIYNGDATTPEQEETLKQSIAFRVIADHIRTLSFSIADSILPGNTGRNYVLRRILRRAVRYGRTLGLKDTIFLAKLVDTLVHEMSRVFPELAGRSAIIKEVLTREESSFNETLDRGLDLFDKEVASTGGVSGDFAFKLYDTYGFPIDLTALMAREQGLSVDENRFEELMEEQRNRAKAAQRKTIVRALDIKTAAQTEFVGHDMDSCSAKVLELHKAGEFLLVITDKSPFYAEMGGQVSDIGNLEIAGDICHVIGVQQIGDARAHLIAADDISIPSVGDEIILSINAERRRSIESNHTATHLLNRALNILVSEDINQQGSLVEPDRLRFDASSGAISKADLRRVEVLVNQWIEEDLPIISEEYAMSEIKQRKEITQNFGDKYGDVVRVVQVGGSSAQFDGESMELCGGTHAKSSKQLRIFKIKSEGAIASGVRRIEACTGESVYEYVRELVEAPMLEMKDLIEKIRETNAKLAAIGQPEFPLPQAESHPGIKAMQSRNITLINSLTDEYLAYCASIKETAIEADKRLKKTMGAAAASLADSILAEQLSGNNLVLATEGGNELLTELFNGLRKRHYQGAAFLIADDGSSLSLGAYCGSEAQAAGLKAGDLIRNLAPIVGGKGGGKADMARGSGKDNTQKTQLIAAAQAALN